jgi:glycogen(starch) synthase
VTKLAAVLWSGEIGGAETYTADLAAAMRAEGADVGVVFVTHAGPLAARLRASGVPALELGLPSGKHVAWRWGLFAEAVRSLGVDGAILPSPGLLPAALRAGGYRSPLVVVAHDATARLGDRHLRERVVRALDLALGYFAVDIDVAVSQFVLEKTPPHARSRRRLSIPNGVDLTRYPSHTSEPGDGRVVGYVGRLVDGKGVDVLLQALARDDTAKLVIAGDGSARPALETLADRLDIRGRVEFRGWVEDVAAVWGECDIAVIPSNGCVESFGMAAVEAMACARPVVVSDTGALPELVEDGVSGIVVPPGDVDALAAALTHLAGSGDLRLSLGRAARLRCEERFDIRLAARSYLQLFDRQDGPSA